jgi:heptosyltransferase-2
MESLITSVRKEIKKVLIINLGAIGDILSGTPLLPVLKKALNCEISFMVKEGNKEVFKYNPYISEIITLKKGFKENVKYLKAKKFDLVILLLPASTKISLMCFLAKIKYKIGCYGGIKKGPLLFFTKRIFPIKEKHVTERFLDIIKQIGIDNNVPNLEIYLSDKEKKDLKKMLVKLKTKNFIVVHPGFSSAVKYQHPSRLWPLDRYAEVIDYLIERYKVKVFLTGNKDEKIINTEIKNKVRNKKEVIISNDFFDIRGFFALISESRLVISSGVPIHIAAAFNIPTIALEGKSNPKEWHPWNPKRNYKWFYHPEVCTGCEKEYCRKKNQECMKAITVKEVVNAADELLNPHYP